MEYKAEQVRMSVSTHPYRELKENEQSVATTVITLAESAAPVRDHFLWSIFNFVCMNFCCLGFVALVYSVKARDRKVMGDVDGSRHFGSTARSFNIAATVLTILLCVIYVLKVTVLYGTI
ncbi:dispanin subfamily A member 2b-like [Mustelus asterias]